MFFFLVLYPAIILLQFKGFIACLLYWLLERYPCFIIEFTLVIL